MDSWTMHDGPYAKLEAASYPTQVHTYTTHFYYNAGHIVKIVERRR